MKPASNIVTDEIVVLDHYNFSTRLSGPVMRDWVLDAIFTNEKFKESVRTTIEQGGLEITNMQPLFALLDQIFESCAGGNGEAPDYVTEQMEALAEYREQYARTRGLFETDNKPNPDAVFWPNPTRPELGSHSVYEVLPVIENLGMVDKDTPIGSAGSCFAIEIAENLMDRDFNYVCKEKSGDPELGVVSADTDMENPTIQFSCNWGLLFNSPSFTQIAEKAFEARKFPRLLAMVNEFPPLYTDPYREGVHFTSIEAYEQDYGRHIQATRDALMECEVFIITLGLNECWQMIRDGSVISRNPRSGMLMSLLRHRTLTVQENIDAIQRFIDIVRAHNPRFKLIVSVSPVPLIATARADEYHVITANGHSKAVLRVAAQELVERNKDVFYFPSYELVTQCTRDPWEADERHVTPATIDRVMEMFDAMFVRGANTGEPPNAPVSGSQPA